MAEPSNSNPVHGTTHAQERLRQRGQFPVTYAKAVNALDAALVENDNLRSLLATAMAEGKVPASAAQVSLAVTQEGRRRAVELAGEPTSAKSFQENYQWLLARDPQAAGAYFHGLAAEVAAM